MSDYLKALDNAVRVLKTHEARASRLAMKEHFDRGPFDPTSLQAEAYRRGVSECVRILDCLVDAKSKHVGAAKKGGDK